MVECVFWRRGESDLLINEGYFHRPSSSAKERKKKYSQGVNYWKRRDIL